MAEGKQKPKTPEKLPPPPSAKDLRNTLLMLLGGISAAAGALRDAGRPDMANGCETLAGMAEIVLFGKTAR